MRATAYLILAATLVLWSGNWIVARAVRDDVSPGIATFARLVIVVLVLLPLAWKDLLPRLRALRARDRAVLAGLGLAGGGVHLAMQWLGLHYTTATSGTLYLSTSPIFILLMAGMFLGERIVALQWAGVGISFAGVALIAAQGDPGALAALSFNRGDLLAVGSMAMWSAYTILLRKRRDALNTVQLLLVVCSLGMLFMAPWLLWELSGAGRAQPAGGRAGRAVLGHRLAAARLRRLELRGHAPGRGARRRHHAPDAGHRGADVGGVPGRTAAVVPFRRHRADPGRRGSRPGRAGKANSPP
ncbi:MAG: DMT family transporter [Betaproteobacteria bacterium]|nr:DMT family transporter [Betaproteobacteria bacterium]